MWPFCGPLRTLIEKHLLRNYLFISAAGSVNFKNMILDSAIQLTWKDCRLISETKICTTKLLSVDFASQNVSMPISYRFLNLPTAYDIFFNLRLRPEPEGCLTHITSYTILINSLIHNISSITEWIRT